MEVGKDINQNMTFIFFSPTDKQYVNVEERYLVNLHFHFET